MLCCSFHTLFQIISCGHLWTVMFLVSRWYPPSLMDLCLIGGLLSTKSKQDVRHCQKSKKYKQKYKEWLQKVRISMGRCWTNTTLPNLVHPYTHKENLTRLYPSKNIFWFFFMIFCHQRLRNCELENTDDNRPKSLFCVYKPINSICAGFFDCF